MNGFIFGFSATLLSAMLWPSLPPLSYLPFFIIGALILYQKVPLCSGGLLALVWLTGCCAGLSRQDLPSVQQAVQVRGEIISLVSENSDWRSFDITLRKSNLIFSKTAKLRLSWQDAPELAVGQVWDFTLAPKSIVSVLNQGGYNEQKQLISQHIIGKGRVKQATLVTQKPSLRHSLIVELTPELRQLPQGDILLALILGDKQLISDARWQALRQTGTGHLVAISGLHLSVITAWCYALMIFLLNTVVPHASRRNLLFSLCLAAGAAAFYAYLAGFAVSTQRALVMILLLMLLTLCKRFSSPWERLLFALFIVLMLDPLACLSAGFWLSFSALAIILYTLDNRTELTRGVGQTDVGTVATMALRLKRSLLAFWAIQWRLSLGLGLLQAALFGGVSLHSLWMNLLVVPWFSLVVIPLAMLGFLCWWLGALLGAQWLGVLHLADISMAPYSALLNFQSQLPAPWLPVAEVWLAFASLAFLGAIVWRYLPFNRHYIGWLALSGLLFLPLINGIWQRIMPIASNVWSLHVLDVGQGLAVVIEKSNRAIVYDTGAAFGDDFSYAQRVILPFLQTKGIREVDYIVISHSDNDHAGGAEVMTAAYPNATVITQMPEFADKDCRPGQFEWQGLTLSLLSPNHGQEGNNGSCVVRIFDAKHSVLLTGDIEKSTEMSLLNKTSSSSVMDTSGLKSHILLAPHHGSKTSSTYAFIDAVAPELVIFPAGYMNRYGFPKADVLTRYQERQIDYLITGREGQISVIFQQDQWYVKTYRRDFAPFWYNNLFRFGDLINPE